MTPEQESTYQQARTVANTAMEAQLARWGFEQDNAGYKHLLGNAMANMENGLRLFVEFDKPASLKESLTSEPLDPAIMTPETVQAISQSHNASLAQALGKPEGMPPAGEKDRVKALAQRHDFEDEYALDDAVIDMLQRIGARAALNVLTKKNHARGIA